MQQNKPYRQKTSHEIEKNKLNEVASLLAKEFWSILKDKYIEGLGVSGSYARGNYSPVRPDVNFIFFVKDDSPKLYLLVNQTLNKIAAKYSKNLNLRPRSEPERPTSPFQRKTSKPDLFIKISYLLLELKDTPGFPFGRPPFVAEAIAGSFKLLYGENHLKNIHGECSNEQIVKGSLAQFRSWNELLRYTPQSYRLPKETDLFFDESLAYGKLLVQQAAWVTGLREGFDYSQVNDRKKVINIISDKEELRKFLSTLGGDIREKAEVILRARLNYEKWKNDPKKAELIYLSSFDLSRLLLQLTNALNQGKRI